jgi:hypothetical protein
MLLTLNIEWNIMAALPAGKIRWVYGGFVEMVSSADYGRQNKLLGGNRE